MKFVLIFVVALLAQPVAAQGLQERIVERFAKASPGTRFGLVVADAAGNEIVAINPDGRFIPASNTKIFTTAAAFLFLLAIDAPDAAGGAQVLLQAQRHGAPDVVLIGRGDARMSSAPDCVTDCLSVLADAVAARVKRVRDIVGDDSYFADQRWSPGMSWNNIATRSGTATSALTLDDNEILMTVTPSAVGARPALTGADYYTVDNRAVTIAGNTAALAFDRAPNMMIVVVTGTIGADAPPQRLDLGIDDPAHYAAWRLKAMLALRGVRVKGDVRSRHRADSGEASVMPPLATLTPSPISEDLTIINKVSQNLHAELMLRRLGRLGGSGSLADGLNMIRAMLDRAGVAPRHYSFSDGSGMSTYNRIAPRGMVRLLRWIAAQPWGAAWRATLPVGGDGMLARRFGATALSGRIFAKTGTLNATSALSGMLIAASGRTLYFSGVANDIPDGDEASRTIDAALIEIAAEN